MRDAMLGRVTMADAGRDDCGVPGFDRLGRAADTGTGFDTRGAGGGGSFGGSGNAPTVRARVGLATVSAFFAAGSDGCLVTPSRALRRLLPLP